MTAPRGVLVELAGGPHHGRSFLVEAPAPPVLHMPDLVQAAQQMEATGDAYVPVQRHTYRRVPRTVPVQYRHDPPSLPPQEPPTA